MAMGAEAEGRRDSFPWCASVPDSMAVLMGVWMGDDAKSVSSFRAFEGARMWYLGTGRLVVSAADGTLECA